MQIFFGFWQTIVWDKIWADFFLKSLPTSKINNNLVGFDTIEIYLVFACLFLVVFVKIILLPLYLPGRFGQCHCDRGYLDNYVTENMHFFSFSNKKYQIFSSPCLDHVITSYMPDKIFGSPWTMSLWWTNEEILPLQILS